ncbi:ABC transporter permease [Nitratireductor sp. ZSWI3]|uniref:ABC transporter permease n=1 Tax=Nitratireductor sp. ZSWI3 TaxID=2966359 RepID=UPI00215047DA|nr:ABC transporter permease [Nitratireductor sp. ZSWI3]MCR4268045.1 ABC transporter permease [Nitratireductor sp. ZSWI3]
MLAQSFLLAFRSVARNKLRSFLTLLGMIIGVAAVNAMLTIGGGAREQVRSQISALGSDLLVVWAGYRNDRGVYTPEKVPPLRIEHALHLKRRLGGAATVAALASKAGRAAFGPNSVEVTLNGVTEDYMRLRNWSIAAGRELTPTEVNSGAGVCIIGETVQKTLFGTESALGARIRLGALACTVVGLLREKGSSFRGREDDAVFLPLETFQTRIAGNRKVESILVSAGAAAQAVRVKARAEEALRESRRIAPDGRDDFVVDDMAELLAFASETIGMFTAFLGAIAGISLLVGGIGIMNVMLVSVAERTREIGIRMAIGARKADILLQFLVEALVLALLGGVVGIGFGLLVAWAAAPLIDIPFAPRLASILFVAGLSMLIGIAFGFFPALRGSRLDPIEALRHE